MNILGVGASELILIFLIALVVAGPRRMTQWAYQFGRVVAQLRELWAEAAQMLQNELEAAGLDEITKLPDTVIEYNPVDEARRALNAASGKAAGKNRGGARPRSTEEAQEEVDDESEETRPAAGS